MYCQNCGNEIIADTNFCQNCGVQLTAVAGEREQTEPTIMLKPQFLTLSMFASMIGWQILFTLWSGVLAGIIGLLLINYYGWNASFWSFALISAALFFFATPIVYIFLMFNRYNMTRYLFFKDRLEYWSGFFKLHKTTLHYHDIIEVNLRSGIIQRFSGIGDIIISTTATNKISLFSKEGIRLFDIVNPDEVFNRIKNFFK